MLLIRELVAFSDVMGRVVGEIDADNPFLDGDGTVHPAACVELLAQAAAAHEGYGRGRRREEPAGGLLVGIRDFSFHGPVRVGDVVTVTAQRGFSFDSMVLVDGSVVVGGKVAASGQLKLYIGSLRGSPGGSLGGSPGGSAGTPEDTSAEVVPALPPPRAGAIVPLPAEWVKDVDEGASRVTFEIDGTAPVFHGHFPGDPLLPAVVSVLLATESRRLLEGWAGPVGKIRSAKFSRPIRPRATLTATLDLAGGRERGTWSVDVLAAGGPAARVVFEEWQTKPATAAGGSECA
jgi:3-hydroxyacyl-[acyl-carrier-protein] dehydratase